MIKLLKQDRWSPYLVGIGIGALSWITFAFMGKALGASTTFVRMVGSFEALFAAEHVRNTEYFAKYLVGAPAFEWQAALVVMMVVGAYTASRLSGSTYTSTMPEIWKERFGSSKPLRYAAAFLGGFLVLFGARLAGGCTSGHAISGGLQLAVSGWVFMAAMFVSGIATAMTLYNKKKN